VTVSRPAFRIREDPVSFDEVLKRRGTLRAYPIGMQLLDEFTKGVLDTTSRFGARDAQNEVVILQCYGCPPPRVIGESIRVIEESIRPLPEFAP